MKLMYQIQLVCGKAALIQIINNLGLIQLKGAGRVVVAYKL